MDPRFFKLMPKIEGEKLVRGLQFGKEDKVSKR